MAQLTNITTELLHYPTLTLDQINVMIKAPDVTIVTLGSIRKV